MQIVLTRCIEQSAYLNAEFSEDIRLAQVHALISRNIPDVIIDDHRLAELDTLPKLRSHARQIALISEICVIFIRQPSANIDFTRRWIKFLRNNGVRFVAIAGDTNSGCERFITSKLVDAIFFGHVDSIARNILTLNETNSNYKGLNNALTQVNGHITRHGNVHQDSPPDLSLPTFYAMDLAKANPAKNHYVPRLRFSTGCYASCTFCHEPSHGRRRSLPHEHINPKAAKVQLEYLYDKGIREISFQDSNFLPKNELGDGWIEEIADFIIKRTPDLSIAFWTRAEDLTTIRMNLLSKISVSHILIGIESMCDDRLRKFGKATTADVNHRAVSLLAEYGIEGKLSFIPFDPEQDMAGLRRELKETSSLLREFPDVQKTPLFAYGLISPHPDTPLYRSYANKGYICDKPSYPFEEHFTYLSRRLVGNHADGVYLPDWQVGISCEAFRLLQYEYAKKWFTALHYGNSARTFFHRLPDRILYILDEIVSVVSEYDGQSPHTLQADVTDLIYSMVWDDYSKFLPIAIRHLETPETIGYGNHWKTLGRNNGKQYY